ncbi:hypothetical protein LTR37_011385 [Vermiconidia calcicola]|uniref:Uncharacterized protein n=1 Tax=Vermiconidia calcicola TaxID=1690605 RepID=A0ACC3N3J4_9PEZI|nr:hypothetical protein LTR37_011385 [Vermiconidia calcicola]
MASDQGEQAPVYEDQLTAMTLAIGMGSGKAPAQGGAEPTQLPEFPATGPSAKSKRERKSVTCAYWAQDRCTNTESECHDAHYLFPVIAERNARYG